MNIKDKNVLVYGMSSSGVWATKLLIKKKANVYVFDDNEETLKNIRMTNCYVLNELNENLISQFDFIVVSPSIEYHNQYLQMARENDVKIFSEVEFASLFCKNMVAITGTNGKTTTTQIITALLQTKYKSIACGNIGFPLSRAVLESKKSIKVVEVSSFMLENCEKFAPHVATITNIEEDHLIRHKTIETYKNLKESIYKNLKSKDYAVVNLDNKTYAKQNCLTVTYSYGHFADVFVKNGAIYLHNDKVVNLNELQLKGKHNIYNIMCAICFAYIYKISLKKIRNVLINLKAEHYRIEKVAKVNDITFINDSKSTNIASTLASTESVKGAIVLLLGGSNKGLEYSRLFKEMTKRVKEIVVYGEISRQLVKENENRFKMVRFETLSQAFEFALSVAKPNDTIMLSPATASYDQYSSYVERGKEFNKLVKEYEVSSKKK